MTTKALHRVLQDPDLLLAMTAFLADVRIEDGRATGRVFADVLERFAEGMRIRTGRIAQVRRLNGYWTIRTVNYSQYLIVSFDPADGLATFANYAWLLFSEAHPAPSTLQ
ncbi:hypothetical protein [Pseudomonas sp. OTU5201]|uniref:hypothetical protein n=1 Tax=Pseudomonas sp. OTU5201 TaxID=3043850 RepID=UPI00313CFDA6